MCKKGFDFSFNPPVVYYCSSAQWRSFSSFPYSGQLPWPDCSSKLISLLILFVKWNELMEWNSEFYGKQVRFVFWFEHWICSNGSTDSLRRRANARNVSSRISLRWLIHIINPVDKTQLSRYTSHRRSTTVSLETYPSDKHSISSVRKCCPTEPSVRCAKFEHRTETEYVHCFDSWTRLFNSVMNTPVSRFRVDFVSWTLDLLSIV